MKMKNRDEKLKDLQRKLAEINEKESVAMAKLNEIREKKKMIKTQIETIEAEKALESANEINSLLSDTGMNLDDLTAAIRNNNFQAIQEKMQQVRNNKINADTESDSNNQIQEQTTAESNTNGLNHI